MAPPLIGRLAAAGLLALAVAACAPADRPAPAPGKAHGVAVEGKLTTQAGVREEKGLSPASPGTHG
ncbi:hypothetical protein DV20_09625 [Amycolatopsis rifamycinica]|uniref:Uncharacterized protein n=1 Tax=Amycolatopsis rifamycinica TaxID=287986 RepID=A0A066UEA7_9PSEU|nr:hypothetical protein DV20_09625 [Amycolatopsis rifamycinica]